MFKWGDKLMYKDSECLFLSYTTSKESAYVVLLGHTISSRVYVEDLKPIK